MSLQTSYRLIAPIYDAVLARATHATRQRSLARLPDTPAKILFSGVGTGLDFPLLPAQHHYTALDFSPAMLHRSRPRGAGLNMAWIQGDSMALPFAAASFDIVVLHLIVAVVPQPARCLSEAARVLKSGGRILLLDKFLRPNQRAYLRRSLSPLAAQIATRLDVVFEDLLPAAPSLRVLRDQPALAGGWFRLIELQKDMP